MYPQNIPNQSFDSGTVPQLPQHLVRNYYLKKLYDLYGPEHVNNILAKQIGTQLGNSMPLIRPFVRRDLYDPRRDLLLTPNIPSGSAIPVNYYKKGNKIKKAENGNKTEEEKERELQMDKQRNAYNLMNQSAPFGSQTYIPLDSETLENALRSIWGGVKKGANWIGENFPKAVEAGVKALWPQGFESSSRPLRSKLESIEEPKGSRVNTYYEPIGYDENKNPYYINPNNGQITEITAIPVNQDSNNITYRRYNPFYDKLGKLIK